MMEKLKLKYLQIKFKDGAFKEFFESDIEHIYTHADSENFIVKIYLNDIKAFSYAKEYIFKIAEIKEIEQRWEAIK